MNDAATARATLTSFAAVAGASARRLILGSMPGAASLAANQYYAQPRNAFWSIMGELYDAEPNLPYAERLAALVRHDIALWDVLKHCERPGSLDSNIVKSSEVANDFAAFFANHRHIREVYFNGAKAQQTFRRHVLRGEPEKYAHLSYRRLPSTSPAHASLSIAKKLAAWRRALEG